MLPNLEEMQRLILSALQEDIGDGDVTSQAVLSPQTVACFKAVAREEMVTSGIEIAGLVFEAVDQRLDFNALVGDGDMVRPGTELFSVQGPATSLLSAERVALNLLQRMCGVATLTAQYVKAVSHTQAHICDTRKTIPGFRSLDKYAVTCGGGYNHRLRLDDAILIKDNHLALAGSLVDAVQRARRVAPVTMQVQVECDTLEQVSEAIEAGASAILLDNMDVETLREAVSLIDGHAISEASGGVNLQTVAAIAETGVERISVGALTHSAPAVDIGLDSVTS